MNYLEAAGYLDSVEADAKFALAYLLDHEFGKALMVGQSLFEELPKYREAISYFIEHDKAQPLARHYNKAYEITCKAVPLLQEAIDSCQQVGEAEAKGSIWGGQIKNLLETRVLPWLNDRHQEAIGAVSSPMGDKMEAPIEKGPQKGENKPQRGRRGRPKASIAWTNKDHNKQCQLLHKLADGKTGRSFALIIKAAVQLGWFVRPPFLAITSEFGDIGSESGYNKQMGLKNDEEVKPFMNLLEKESQI